MTKIKWMEIAKNLLLAGASVAITLVALEFGVRAFEGIPLVPRVNFVKERVGLLENHTNNVYDPVLGWRHKPNLQSAERTPDKSFTLGEFGVRMNQPELRPVPRNAIVAVGDSFTVGSDVGDTQSWPAYLERKIGSPVVNAASGGYGTDQLTLLGEMVLDQLQPKTLILEFADGDIDRVSLQTYGGGSKPYFSLEGGKLVHQNKPVPKFAGTAREIGWVRLLFGYSYLIDWTMRRLGVKWWFRAVDDGFIKARDAGDPVTVTCLLFARLKDETDARNVRLVLFLQWDGGVVARETKRFAKVEKVLACSRQKGIQVVDTWDRLRLAFSAGEKHLQSLFIMHGSEYTHMTSKGNELMADILSEGIRDPNFDGSVRPH